MVDPEIKVSGPLISAPPPRTKEQLEFDREAMKPRPPPEPEPEPEPVAPQGGAAQPDLAALLGGAAGGGGGDQNAALAGLLQLLAQSQQK